MYCLLNYMVQYNQNISPLLPGSQVKSQNVITQSTVGVTVEEPLTYVDKISDVWNKLGNPIIFSYGILAGLSPWIFGKLKERLKKK
jgi:hypothetical protein